MPSEKIFAGINQLRTEVGAKTVDLVVEQLECNELGLPKHPKTTMIDGLWCDGPSILAKRK